MADFKKKETKPVLSQKSKFITAETERLLLQKAQKGDVSARDELVLVHRPFIQAKAKEIKAGLYERENHVPLEDLISEGTIGIIRAIKNFDLSKEYRFLTYAGYWIEKYIRKELRRQLSPVYIPSDKITLANKIRKAKEILFQEQGCEPTIEDIAEYLGLPVKQIEGVKLPGRESMDAPIKVYGKNETAPLYEVLSDQSQSPEELINSKQVKRQLELLLSKLTLKQKMVLELHFGLNEKEVHSLTEIAISLGVSTERIRQLKEIGLENLRKVMESNSNSKENLQF